MNNEGQQQYEFNFKRRYYTVLCLLSQVHNYYTTRLDGVDKAYILKSAMRDQQIIMHENS